jgi:hypothetical protein
LTSSVDTNTSVPFDRTLYRLPLGIILQANQIGLFRYGLWRVGVVDRFRTKSEQSVMVYAYFSLQSFMVFSNCRSRRTISLCRPAKSQIIYEVIARPSGYGSVPHRRRPPNKTADLGAASIKGNKASGGGHEYRVCGPISIIVRRTTQHTQQPARWAAHGNEDWIVWSWLMTIRGVFGGGCSMKVTMHRDWLYGNWAQTCVLKERHLRRYCFAKPTNRRK